MEWTPRQKWFLNLSMVALQGLTTLAWNTTGIDPHWIALGSQVIAYTQIILNFMIYGAAPPPKNGGKQ